MSDKVVFVAGLHPSTTEDQMLPYFRRFGTVTCIRFKYNRETGACLGFGFVEYSTVEGAAAVLQDETLHSFTVAAAFKN